MPGKSGIFGISKLELRRRRALRVPRGAAAPACAKVAAGDHWSARRRVKATLRMESAVATRSFTRPDAPVPRPFACFETIDQVRRTCSKLLPRASSMPITKPALVISLYGLFPFLSLALHSAHTPDSCSRRKTICCCDPLNSSAAGQSSSVVPAFHSGRHLVVARVGGRAHPPPLNCLLFGG